MKRKLQRELSLLTHHRIWYPQRNECEVVNRMNELMDQYFSIIEDPRCTCDIKYKLKDILILVMCATLCGQDSLERIVQYGENKAAFLKTTFGIERTPSKSTLSRVLSTIDAKAVISSIVSMMREMLGTNGKVVAIDGKAICSRANMKTTQALHILTAYMTENGVTLGQVNVHEKTNEIPLMQDLLPMVQIKGKVVTADAMHCQTETCAKIVEAEADYLLQVKGNQPDLLDNVQLFMDDLIKTDVQALDYAQTVENNRGRHEERTCYVSSDIDWYDRKQVWQGLHQFAAIKRLVIKDGKETVEWHYYITSVVDEAEKILRYARDHWKIESMHWQLDVTFSEDDCRVISAQTQQSLNIFRKLALALQKNYLEGHRHLKGYKRKAMSAHMFDCLLKDSVLLDVIKM